MIGVPRSTAYEYTCLYVFVCLVSVQCTSESSNSTCVTISPTRPAINYNVKVVNPVRKSEYVIRKVRGIPKYTTMEELKAKICEKLTIDIEEMGYISPGHGMKGKLNPLTCDEDLEDMYAEYKSKNDIMLWCSTPLEHSKSDVRTEKKQRKKRSLTFDQPREEVPQPPKKQGCAQKITDVEAIMDTLKEKHGPAYTVEQLSAWAHMVQMGKHVSTEVPPALPYFGKAKSSNEKQEAEIQLTQQSSPPSAVLSPGKRISLRSECMDQLSKWYSHLEKGVISQSKYEELQGTILGDISTL